MGPTGCSAKLVPSLPQPWHLWGGTWKMNFLLKGPLSTAMLVGKLLGT